MKMREIAPVIMIKPFLEAATNGANLEVLAQADLVAEGGTVTGKWILYVLLMDEDTGKPTRAVLIKQRAAEPRVIKTLKGLIGFALQIGIKNLVIPHRSGQRVIWEPLGDSERDMNASTKIFDDSRGSP